MAGTKAKGLGKGIEALFGDVEINSAEVTTKKETNEKVAHDAIVFVDINDIKPNELQPRTVFDEEKIEELANSIATHGVIQPLVLKETKRGFEIIAGERRWRAARKAGLKQVPGIIKELTKEQLMVVSLIENIQREDLNPMEEAEAIRRICSEFGLTQDAVSKSIGKSRPYITNLLRLLKLPEQIQRMVLEGKLSNGHARALIGVLDSRKQLALAEKIVAEDLSVRETEKLVQQIDEKPKLVQKKRPEKQTEIASIEEELKGLLGTKVELKHKGKTGKLEIAYFSRSELERLIEMFRRLKSEKQ
jgi:ParB family chromosome partitioning protein